MKRRNIEMQSLEITPLVEEVVALVRADAVTRRIMIRSQMLNELPVVRGDRVQLGDYQRVMSATVAYHRAV